MKNVYEEKSSVVWPGSSRRKEATIRARAQHVLRANFYDTTQDTMRHPCASTGKNVVSRVHRGCASFHGHATNTLAFKSFRIIYSNLNSLPQSNLFYPNSSITFILSYCFTPLEIETNRDWSVDFKHDFEENCWSTMTRYATWPEIKTTRLR